MKKKADTTADGKKESLSRYLRLFQLLRQHMMRIHHGERLNEISSVPSSSSGSKVLSTNDIMRMARSTLLECTSDDVVSILIKGSCGAYSGTSSETYADDLELAMLIHASAFKISTREFDRARKLLSMCRQFSSVSGNTIQRIVLYFAGALHKRISRELESIPSENPEGNQRHEMAVEEAAATIFDMIQIENYLPFCRIAEYTAMQYILDNVSSAKRVHLVDLGIRIGSHWPVLMQGLEARADQSECPLEMLKLTAIGTSKENMEEIGKHLSSFAETMKIPFQFKILVSELQNLKEDMFEVEPGEALVVYSELRLSSLLAWPDRLESLLRTIVDLHPSAFVTTEFDANTNASDFIDRFDEAVNLASAVLDCIEDCVDQDNPCRAIMEQVFVREAIQNIITAEGEERVHRHLRIDAWRGMMAKFGLVEIPPSDYALNQARMLLNNNPRWSGCTLVSDGKCMIVGWRGNPIKSVSAWTFRHS